jgi:hypothetical protein
MSHAISSAAAGSFSRNTPSPHPPSPFFNKPQSPPALIIPNQQHSPSPVLPPIVTSTEVTAPSQNQQQQAGVGLGRGSGGLFPPANPALEGLTGMAGISPIAPSADGPMIYIQPSTPISGLKDGRGVFDFKRFTQGQGQQGGQQSHEGFTVPQPASHTISRHSSVEALDQLAHAQSSGNTGQPFPSFAGQEWATQDWSALRPALGSRPRAKSDSQMGLSGVEMYNRQVMADLGVNAAGGGQFSIPQGLSEEDLRAAIDHWRTTSSFPTADQDPTAPTMDPRTLPGQEGQDLLNEFKLSQQFAQLQAQRNRLPTLNTGASGNAGGMKLEPGQFSPTSLAFYSSMGLNPQSHGQLATSSAPYFQTTFQEVPNINWPQTAGPGQSFLMPDQGGLGPRRRSFAEGMNHPAAGAGTPGYGVEFVRSSPFGTLDPGRIRGNSPMGHRRAAKSEDLGRPGAGSGWGVGQGGSTWVLSAEGDLS